MSTVNDFPIPNGSCIKIVKLSEDTTALVKYSSTTKNHAALIRS